MTMYVWEKRDKWKVLQFLAMGYSTAEIAIEMGMTYRNMQRWIRLVKKEKRVAA